MILIPNLKKEDFENKKISNNIKIVWIIGELKIACQSKYIDFYSFNPNLKKEIKNEM